MIPLSICTTGLFILLLSSLIDYTLGAKAKSTTDKPIPVSLTQPATDSTSLQFSIPPGSILEMILSLAGPAFFICLQISSASTAYEISQKKTVGKLSPIPFGSLFINCLLWTAYGLLRNDKAVYVPNGSGFLVSIYCLYVYHQHVGVKPWNMYGLIACLSILCLLLALTNEVQMIGLIGCLLSIILSGSPLAVIKTVITEQSTAALPFYTSLITWLNNFSWICYGYLIADDPLIYYPNMLGFTLSSLQMVLFVRYGFPKKRDDDTAASSSLYSNDAPLQRL